MANQHRAALGPLSLPLTPPSENNSASGEVEISTYLKEEGHSAPEDSCVCQEKTSDTCAHATDCKTHNNHVDIPPPMISHGAMSTLRTRSMVDLPVELRLMMYEYMDLPPDAKSGPWFGIYYSCHKIHDEMVYEAKRKMKDQFINRFHDPQDGTIPGIEFLSTLDDYFDARRLMISVREEELNYPLAEIPRSNAFFQRIAKMKLRELTILIRPAVTQIMPGQQLNIPSIKFLATSFAGPFSLTSPWHIGCCKLVLSLDDAWVAQLEESEIVRSGRTGGQGDFRLKVLGEILGDGTFRHLEWRIEPCKELADYEKYFPMRHRRYL